MFWQQTRERRKSTPQDRADFEMRKRELESERDHVERRLNYLETEASLYARCEEQNQNRR